MTRNFSTDYRFGYKRGTQKAVLMTTWGSQSPKDILAHVAKNGDLCVTNDLEN